MTAIKIRLPCSNNVDQKDPAVRLYIYICTRMHRSAQDEQGGG